MLHSTDTHSHVACKSSPKTLEPPSHRAYVSLITGGITFGYKVVTESEQNALFLLEFFIQGAVISASTLSSRRVRSNGLAMSASTPGSAWRRGWGCAREKTINRQPAPGGSADSICSRSC